MKMASIRGWAMAWSLALAACSGDPSEQRLRATIDAMQSAAEKRDIAALMEGVAEDFVGNDGEFDRRQLALYLRGVAVRHRSVQVTRLATDIEMHGEAAVVRMKLLVTGSQGSVLPDRGSLYEVDSTWRFEDSFWRLVGATWRRGG
jgi:hypothetical protein